MLVWFEGFETCGNLLGSANASTVRPNIDKRVEVASDSGTGPVWLVDSSENDGYALSLGSSFNNRLIKNLPGHSLDREPTGPDASIITIGGRVHIPDDPSTFDALGFVVDGISGGNRLFLGARVVSSTGLSLMRGSGTYITVDDVFTPGTWAYIEVSIRPDGGRGNFAKAEVASEPSDGSSTLTISEFEQYLPIWRPETTYGEEDTVRWMGRAYECLLVGLGETEGDIPPENPAIWNDIGSEDDNTDTENNLGFQPIFFIKEDPYRQWRVALGVGGNPPSSISCANDYEHDSGEYIPQPGDTVIFGVNSFFEIRVDGVSYMRGQLIPGAVHGTLGDNVWRFFQQFEMRQNSGISYEPDYYGPGKIVSLPPTSDVTDNWTPSTGSDHYVLIDENGNNDADYVEASTDVLDQYGHTDTALGGQFHAVRIEVEAINTTSGEPNLIVSMGSGGEVSESFVVDNTADSEIFTLESTSQPGGGEWDTDGINDLISGIESDGL